MFTLFKLFGLVFLAIWCVNAVPTPLFSTTSLQRWGCCLNYCRIGCCRQNTGKSQKWVGRQWHCRDQRTIHNHTGCTDETTYFVRQL